MSQELYREISSTESQQVSAQVLSEAYSVLDGLQMRVDESMDKELRVALNLTLPGLPCAGKCIDNFQTIPPGVHQCLQEGTLRLHG